MKSHGALTTLDEREIRLFPCNSLGGRPRTPSGEYRLGHVTSLCFVKGFCVVLVLVPVLLAKSGKFRRRRNDGRMTGRADVRGMWMQQSLAWN